MITTIVTILIFFNLYIFLFLWSPFDNLYPPIEFYFANPVSNKFSDQSHYNVSAFATDDDDLNFNFGIMIHIMPQDLYFFLYNNILIYHKKIEYTGKCNNEYVEAYIVNKSSSQYPNNKMIICHRKLEYLRKLYNRKIFYKTFDSLQHPEIVIKSIIKSFSKTRGYNKVLEKCFH